MGIIVIIVSVLWIGSEIGLSLMMRSHTEDIHLDKSSIRILWITIVFSIVLANVVASFRVGLVESAASIAVPAGIVLMVLGLLIRWIAIFTLRRYFTVDVAIAKDHRLLKEGMYRIVRHPSYTGSLVSFLGLGFCSSNYVSLLIIFVPICAAFLYRIRIEEEALRAAFGDEYMKYCAATRRLIPGIY